jgi:hypothetical protein
MERLTLRAYVVAGLLVVTAAWAQLSPRPGKVVGKTEAWMEQVTPMKVDGSSFIPDSDPKNLYCSYKDIPMVYDALRPTVGIVARRFQIGGRLYDVTLIASNDRSSFHDPRVCFTAQGYDLTDGPLVNIPTKTRGNIPATLAPIKAPDGRPSTAVYFYKGPRGFYGTTTSLKFALFWDQLAGRSNLDGVFYRFILDGESSPEAQEKLIKFVSTYMDQANHDSNGYF